MVSVEGSFFGPKDDKHDFIAGNGRLDDLSFDKEEGSYVMDVDDNDPDWDHPMDYAVVSEGAKDDMSSYDASNPYVGSEYAGLDNLKEDDLKNAAMQIRDEKFLKLSKFDQNLALNEEDFRDDLDEEGYPTR